MKLILINYKECIKNGINKVQDRIILMILKALGIAANFSPHTSKNNTPPSAPISADGRYAISWSENGLIYLVFLSRTPCVISFTADPGRNILSALFSNDMQRIVITYIGGDTTVLSAVPGEGFNRRKVLIAEPFCSYETPFQTSNIAEFIFQTSSAYWKRTTIPDTKQQLLCALPTGTPMDYIPPANFDWDDWISNGERYWERICGHVRSRLN